jgi:hypothetical protein
VTDRRLGAVVVALAAGCSPFTTRPAITPLPEAAAIEVRLPVQEATRELAAALQADSIPTRRVRLRDGYLESGWFDSQTGRPTGRRPLGTGVVKVRGWADPGRPGNTLLIVETLYRPLADPSLPERELEKQVPRDHPVAVKVDSALAGLVKRYGGPPTPEARPPAAPVQEPAEEPDQLSPEG